MPELPEVEHIRTWLRPQLTGETIASLRLAPGAERCLPQGKQAIDRLLRGKTVTDVRRRSKVILMPAGATMLAIHLKMTGKLWTGRAAEPRPEARVSVIFESGNALFFEDQRKFGWLQAWSPDELSVWEREQGPEPVPHLPPGWAERLQSRRPIKAVLLDQGVVAGIGNIYADEILFACKLHPQRTALSLTRAERSRLTASVEAEMQAAVEEREGAPDQKRVGSGDRSVKSLFKWRVFQRENEPCVQCGTPIERRVVAGRGTYVCPGCQHASFDSADRRYSSPPKRTK